MCGRRSLLRPITASAFATTATAALCTQPRLSELQRPVDVHFTMAGSRQLAEDVARCVRVALAAK